MTTITKYFQVPDLVRYASAVGITSASSVLLGGVLLNINYYNCRRQQINYTENIEGVLLVDNE